MASAAAGSIRSTSARAILWTTGATLLATLVAVVLVEANSSRQGFQTQLSVLGEITATYATPALEFDDPAAGHEALGALKRNPAVTFAALLDTHGKVFATVGTPPAELGGALGAVDGFASGSGYVDWTQPVASESGRLGTLVIRASTGRLFREITEVIVAVVLIGCLAMAMAWLAASRMSDRLVGPLAELARASEAMSGGDLTAALDLDLDREDEVGTLGAAFVGMRNHLRELVTRLGESVVAVNGEAGRLGEASEAMFAEARKQESAASETTESIERMSSSVWQVGSIAESLAETAADSSRATTEIDAAVERAAASIDRVFESADSAASSVLEMTAAIRQIGENADHLAGATGATIDSMEGLRVSVSDVAANAQRTSESTRQATESALLGEAAVGEAIVGMREIENSFSGLEKIIDELAERSQSIHDVLQVIDGVVEQTNLLALNAAIISSQAGEHGRAFSVVAQEIKNLAERTQLSTREISDSIELVLGGVASAVEATAVGADRVRDGARRSADAGEALRKIRVTTAESSEAVAAIVAATASQGSGIEAVAGELDRVRELVGQVTHATHEQSSASADIQRSVESVRQLAEDLKRSTSEQTDQSRFTAEAVARVVVGVSQIHEAISGQRSEVEQILEAVKIFEDGATETSRRAEQMKSTVAALHERSETVKAEVERFRV